MTLLQQEEWCETKLGIGSLALIDSWGATHYSRLKCGTS
ncbi:hypothetical protein Goari_000511 [Gossypium aridum]|uniref:Uncharacterized protein n=1 Tax=Gossypium aridum TaxID=34290 RepID=A0A7J8YGW0_GOSAI|nr:hypothetical protein [Gossypium aridum]